MNSAQSEGTVLSYVHHVLLGDLQGMSSAMSNAYVGGDLLGNFAVAAHMTLAVAIGASARALDDGHDTHGRHPCDVRWDHRREHG